MASGRTDKHVSALSQIISFHTFDESITAESIHGLFAESEASSTGRLKLFQCVRVPRKFHALFLATWYVSVAKCSLCSLSFIFGLSLVLYYMQETVYLSLATAEGFPRGRCSFELDAIEVL